jgi:hypothetical protein
MYVHRHGVTLQYGVARIMNLSYGEFRRGVLYLLAVHRMGIEPAVGAGRSHGFA